MSELNQDYIVALHKEIMGAIFKVSADRQKGALPGEPKTLYIGSAEVCQALTMLLAEFVEGNPDLVTPGDVRHMSDVIARKIRLGIGESRRHRAETGGQPLPAITTRSN